MPLEGRKEADDHFSILIFVRFLGSGCDWHSAGDEVISCPVEP